MQHVTLASHRDGELVNRREATARRTARRKEREGKCAGAAAARLDAHRDVCLQCTDLICVSECECSV
jgi:hypothetical protein